MELKELQPAIDFLKKLTPQDNVLVLMHDDGDGYGAGVPITEFLDEQNISYHARVASSVFRYGMSDRVRDMKKELDFNTFIVLDFSLPDPLVIKELIDQGVKVLIVDHHTWSSPPDERAAYVNPWNPKQDYPAVAAMCNYIYEEAGGQKDLKWLGYLGSTTDLLLFNSLPFLRLPKEQEKGYIINGQAVGLTELMAPIGAGYLDPDICQTIYELLKKSVKENSPVFIVMNKKGEAKPIYDVMQRADDEVQEAIKKLKTDAIVDHDLKWVYLKIKPQLNIKRHITHLIRDSFAGYTVSVGSESNGKISVSSRSNQPILHEVMPKSVEGFGNGGGHAKAAGCGFPADKEQQWISNMKRLLKEYQP